MRTARRLARAGRELRESVDANTAMPMSQPTGPAVLFDGGQSQGIRRPQLATWFMVAAALVGVVIAVAFWTSSQSGTSPTFADGGSVPPRQSSLDSTEPAEIFPSEAILSQMDLVPIASGGWTLLVPTTWTATAFSCPDASGSWVAADNIAAPDCGEVPTGDGVAIFGALKRPEWWPASGSGEIAELDTSRFDGFVEDGWTGIWASADSPIAAEVARRSYSPPRLGGDSQGASSVSELVELPDASVVEIAIPDGLSVFRADQFDAWTRFVLVDRGGGRIASRSAEVCVALTSAEVLTCLGATDDDRGAIFSDASGALSCTESLLCTTEVDGYTVGASTSRGVGLLLENEWASITGPLPG